MALKVEKENNKFRLLTQDFTTEWIPNILANRQTILVVMRLLENKKGKKLFSLQELAQITNGVTTAASSRTIKKFKDREQDFQKLHVYTKPKIDEEVINAMKIIVIKDPLLSLEEIARRTNHNLNREDINRWHVEWALDQYIGYYEIRKVLKKRLHEGQYNHKDSYVLDHLFKLAEKTGNSNKVNYIPEKAKESWAQASKSIEGNDALKPEISKFDQLPKDLFSGKIDKENLGKMWNSPMGWYLWAFLLYYKGVSLSTIGSWLGVHKSTVSRWLTKFSQWAEYWIAAQEKNIGSSNKIAVDEKWIKINGVWWYLFAAVDCITHYPLHVAIYPGNGTSYCKLFLLALKQKGYYPKTIITDGWDAYIKAIQDVFPKSEHLLCRFHFIQSIFRKLYLDKISNSNILKNVAKLFKSQYKRTVLRRANALKSLLQNVCAKRVLRSFDRKFPQILKNVGSTWRPSTSNAVESFFSQFDRFYRLKGPFQNQYSANKHLYLFMLGYLFSIGASGQASPLEKAGRDVISLPFYHLFNCPNVVLLKKQMAA